MHDPCVSEAEQRLERLEREARRRKFDSAIMVWNRDGTATNLVPGAHWAAREALADVAGPTAPPPDEPNVLELMAERLDLLERKAARLEGELRRSEGRARKLGRVAIALALGTLALAALGLPLASRWRAAGPTAAHASTRPPG